MTDTPRDVASPTSAGEPTPCCAPLGPATLDPGEAERLAVLLKALADPVRLRLLSIVATTDVGEVCACDFPEALGRSQSTVSHHLSQLVAAGLLRREQRGKWAWFSIEHDRLDEVASALSGTSAGASPDRASS